MNKSIRIIKLILRILIGAFFITTAIFKLLSLDNFEIYIYSFNIFGFILSSIVARLVIMAELLLGGLLISKILYKQAWWLTMAMLFGFTLLLVYVAIFRHDANCHCMGDIVQLNPAVSIVKNIVTMALMLLIRKEEDYYFRGKVAVGIVLLVASFAVPFACFPMDNVYLAFSRQEVKIDDKKMTQFLQDSVAQSLNIQQGDYLLGFFSSSCQYCKLSARKLNTIVQNNQLDSSKVIFFIWGGEKSIQKFKDETETNGYRFSVIGPVEAIELVLGAFPTYVYIHDGKVEKAVDVRGLDERSVVALMSNE